MLTEKDKKFMEVLNAEFSEGLEAVPEEGNEKLVAVFGSARTKETERAYIEAVKLGNILGLNKYQVITGGGPGIMQAAQQGCFLAGGQTIGMNIILPMEQNPNPYQKVSVNFNYFFTRKVCFYKRLKAITVFQGGYGTIDEMFEALTLIQTHKMQNIPIVLVGKAFWTGLKEWIVNVMLEAGAISSEDPDMFTIVDTAEEAFEIIKKEV